MVSRLFAALALVCVLSGCLRPVGDLSHEGGEETGQVAAAAEAAGDPAEAARLYERAAEQDPDSVSALTGLGRAYITLGQFSRAENALNRARSLAPRNPTVHNQLGKLSLHRGDPAAAGGHFSESVRLDKRNLDGLTGKAVSLDYLSRHSEAQVVYRQALAIYPTNFVLLSNYALSMVLAGEHEAGLALMEELRKDPNMGASVMNNLAIAHALSGNTREARAILQQSLGKRDVETTLKLYAEARRAREEGKPIGHMIFE